MAATELVFGLIDSVFLVFFSSFLLLSFFSFFFLFPRASSFCCLLSPFFSALSRFLAEKLNMEPADAELWIVNLIRSCHLDGKIDSETESVVLRRNYPSVSVAFLLVVFLPPCLFDDTHTNPHTY